MTLATYRELIFQAEEQEASAGGDMLMQRGREGEGGVGQEEAGRREGQGGLAGLVARLPCRLALCNGA